MFSRDIRYALRSLAKNPVFSAVAILSLFLGIGANTAMFSLINALILRSLPVHDPAQLVSITLIDREGREGGLSVAMLRQIQHDQRVFSGMFGGDGGGLTNFEADNGAWAAGLEVVTGDYFRTLGVQPALGRLIRPEDAPLGSLDPGRVAVLSYACWQARFHGDTAVIGKQVRVEGTPLTIIGVAPQGFAGLTIDAGFDVAVPFHYSRVRRPEPQDDWLPVLARLEPGIGIEQARAQMEALWPAIRAASVPRQLEGQLRTSYFARRISIRQAGKGISWLRQRFTKPLMVLTALVGLTLLIACVNLASLMLARATGRARENGIRLALGAGTWTLIRQSLTESLLLSCAGAILGLAAAGWLTHLLVGFIWGGYVGLAIDVSPDGRVAAFAGVIAILTAVLFGVAPAWRASQIDPLGAVQQTSRIVGARSGRLGRLLVTGQVALSLVLLTGALLFVRSLRNLRDADAGFRRDHILMATLFPKPGGYRDLDKAAYYRDLAARVGRLPAVRAVSFSNLAPLMLYEYKESVSPKDRSGESVEAVTDTVGPGFFSLMGMRVLAGREFDWRDDKSAPRVAIVSESFARHVFPNIDALGEHIRFDSEAEQQDLEIVGVVNSASLWLIRTNEPMAVYTPIAQNPYLQVLEPNIDVLTAVEPGALAGSVGRVIESMGHERPLRFQTLEARTDWLLTNDRLIALLSTFFGAIVLFLAAIGLYALMSFTVARRTAEIGVRMAVGASRASVLGLVLRDVVRLVAAGISVGLPATLVASRFLAEMLFGLPPVDAVSLLVSCVVLLAIAVVAGYLPARRASLLDPMEALRSE